LKSLTGYHHITACAGGAQEDVEFFTQALVLRMTKQTVRMDKIPRFKDRRAEIPEQLEPIRVPETATAAALRS
jgi:catechol 2,3-dioxygenase-like lactoylglutathione lyase family enzyme